MKTVAISSFTDLDDALLWVEMAFRDVWENNLQDDIKMEVALISGKFRASVITDTRQQELDL